MTQRDDELGNLYATYKTLLLKAGFSTQRADDVLAKYVSENPLPSSSHQEWITWKAIAQEAGLNVGLRPDQLHSPDGIYMELKARLCDFGLPADPVDQILKIYIQEPQNDLMLGRWSDSVTSFSANEVTNLQHRAQALAIRWVRDNMYRSQTIQMFAEAIKNNKKILEQNAPHEQDSLHIMLKGNLTAHNIPQNIADAVLVYFKYTPESSQPDLNASINSTHDVLQNDLRFQMHCAALRLINIGMPDLAKNIFSPHWITSNLNELNDKIESERPIDSPNQIYKGLSPTP